MLLPVQSHLKHIELPILKSAACRFRRRMGFHLFMSVFQGTVVLLCGPELLSLTYKFPKFLILVAQSFLTVECLTCNARLNLC